MVNIKIKHCIFSHNYIGPETVHFEAILVISLSVNDSSTDCFWYFLGYFIRPWSLGLIRMPDFHSLSLTVVTVVTDPTSFVSYWWLNQFVELSRSFLSNLWVQSMCWNTSASGLWSDYYWEEFFRMMCKGKGTRFNLTHKKAHLSANY